MWIQIGVLEIEKIRVFEAFAGIGSQRMALHNLGIPHEVVGIAEIDKYAIQSYNAIWVDKTLILSIFEPYTLVISMGVGSLFLQSTIFCHFTHNFTNHVIHLF